MEVYRRKILLGLDHPVPLSTQFDVELPQRYVVVQGKCYLYCSAILSPLVIESFVRPAPRMIGSWFMSMATEYSCDHGVIY